MAMAVATGTEKLPLVTPQLAFCDSCSLFSQLLCWSSTLSQGHKAMYLSPIYLATYSFTYCKPTWCGDLFWCSCIWIINIMNHVTCVTVYPYHIIVTFDSWELLSFIRDKLSVSKPTCYIYNINNIKWNLFNLCPMAICLCCCYCYVALKKLCKLQC